MEESFEVSAVCEQCSNRGLQHVTLLDMYVRNAQEQDLRLRDDTTHDTLANSVDTTSA